MASSYQLQVYRQCWWEDSVQAAMEYDISILVNSLEHATHHIIHVDKDYDKVNHEVNEELTACMKQKQQMV